MNEQTRFQETSRRGSQPRPLRTRHQVKPDHPDYDAHVLAHIKSKVLIDANGCWLWQGPVPAMRDTGRGFSAGGYPHVGYRSRGLAVHRVVWMIHNGPQPKKMDICHTCDVRHCCNPDHLWLGTRSENLRDMIAKGRGPLAKKAAQTHCHNGHELSGDNLILKNNSRSRWCKICYRALHASEKYVIAGRERARRSQARKRALRLASQEQRT